jgi:hypothetical protein
MSGFLEWLTGEPAARGWLSRLLEPGAPAPAAATPMSGGEAGGADSNMGSGAWLGDALRSGLYGLAAGASAPGGFAGGPGAGLVGALRANEARRQQRLAEAMQASQIRQQTEAEKRQDDQQKAIDALQAPTGIDPAQWALFKRAFPEVAAALAGRFL